MSAAAGDADDSSGGAEAAARSRSDRRIADLNEASAAQGPAVERRPSFSEGKAKEVKVVMLGDAGVGKSSLLLRFTQGTFEGGPEPTVGVSFQSKLLIVGVKPFKFQIWDTAGQERYHSLAPLYYRAATAALLVYDLTNRRTFATSLKNWVAELREKGPRDILLVLVGNKADLSPEKREVSTEEAQQYAMSIGAQFVEASALADLNVAEIFTGLGHHLVTTGRDRSLSTGESSSLGAAVRRRSSSGAGAGGGGSLAAAAAAAVASTGGFSEGDDEGEVDGGAGPASLQRRDSLTLHRSESGKAQSCC